MNNPFETNVKGAYKLNSAYSQHGLSGVSEGEPTLYQDNRIVGTTTDSDSKAVLKRTALGLYNPYNRSIELVKIKEGRWNPIVWKVSKNKFFPNVF